MSTLPKPLVLSQPAAFVRAVLVAAIVLWVGAVAYQGTPGDSFALSLQAPALLTVLPLSRVPSLLRMGVHGTELRWPVLGGQERKGQRALEPAFVVEAFVLAERAVGAVLEIRLERLRLRLAAERSDALRARSPPALLK